MLWVAFLSTKPKKGRPARNVLFFLVKQRGVQLCSGLCLRQAACDCTFGIPWRQSLQGDSPQLHHLKRFAFCGSFLVYRFYKTRDNYFLSHIYQSSIIYKLKYKFICNPDVDKFPVLTKCIVWGKIKLKKKYEYRCVSSIKQNVFLKCTKWYTGSKDVYG